MFRKGSYDPWEPTWFKARVSQVRPNELHLIIEKDHYPDGMLNLDLSKTFDQVSAFIFFISWKIQC